MYSCGHQYDFSISRRSEKNGHRKHSGLFLVALAFLIKLVGLLSFFCAFALKILVSYFSHLLELDNLQKLTCNN